MSAIVIDGQRQPKVEPLGELELRDTYLLPHPQPLVAERSLQDFYLAGGWIPTVPAELMPEQSELMP